MDTEKGVVVPLNTDLPFKEGEKKKQYLVALAGKFWVLKGGSFFEFWFWL